MINTAPAPKKRKIDSEVDYFFFTYQQRRSRTTPACHIATASRSLAAPRAEALTLHGPISAFRSTHGLPTDPLTRSCCTRSPCFFAGSCQERAHMPQSMSGVELHARHALQRTCGGHRIGLLKPYATELKRTACEQRGHGSARLRKRAAQRHLQESGPTLLKSVPL